MNDVQRLRGMEPCGFHEIGDPACRCPETVMENVIVPAVQGALRNTVHIQDKRIRARYIVKDLELSGVEMRALAEPVR